MSNIGLVRNKRLIINSTSLLLYIVYFTVFWGILYDLFMVPGLVLFINDFVLVVSLLLVSKNRLLKRNNTIIVNYILIYLLFIIIGCLLNFQSIFHFVFGIRNNFRYYLFFFLCITSISEKTVIHTLDDFDGLFYLNAIVLFIQRFVFGYEQDMLGGLFGLSYGCNGSLNIFLVIITAKSIIGTLDKKEDLRSCVAKCSLSLVIAALTELKIYFFEFALILAFAVIVTRFSFRKVLVVIGALVGLLVGVEILVKLFPGFAGFFTLEGATRIVTAGTYSDSSAFNRFTFVPFLNGYFLTTPQLVYMGMGIGNCELSSISLFDTMFYHNYGWMHYDWFQSTFTYLEQGAIGLVMLVGFFVLILLCYLRHYKKEKNYGVYIKMSIICAIISIVLIFYNQSMRTEAGYLMYFVLSIPFILTKRYKGEISNEYIS